MHVVGGCNVVASEHERYDICLVFRSCGEYEQRWVCIACWSVKYTYVLKFYCY